MRADIYPVPIAECDTAHPEPGYYIDLVEEPDADPIGPFSSHKVASIIAVFIVCFGRSNQTVH